MRREHLGDSYDAVKRLWCDLLIKRAPLQADARFVPEDLRKEYTCLTGIPILADQRPDAYSILNDPDTGIRRPDQPNWNRGRTHICIESIAQQLTNDAVLCVITYDQSFDRRLSHRQQRQAKMEALRQAGYHAFYYVSHAPFLFAFPNEQAEREVRSILVRAGVPDTRFDGIPGNS